MTQPNPLVAHARELIAAERESIARLRAEDQQDAADIREWREQIAVLEASIEEREVASADRAVELASHERALRELEQALAMLEERLTDPKPMSPERERVHRELDEMMRSRRPDPEPEPPVRDRVRPREAKAPRGSGKDPMIVLERDTGSHPAPKPNGLTPVYEGGGGSNLDIDNLSQTDIERADLVLMLMEDAGGRCSQCDLATSLRDVLSIAKPSSASAIASRALAILHRQGRVEYTGDKGPISTGRMASPIYQVKEGH